MKRPKQITTERFPEMKRALFRIAPEPGGGLCPTVGPNPTVLNAVMLSGADFPLTQGNQDFTSNNSSRNEKLYIGNFLPDTTIVPGYRINGRWYASVDNVIGGDCDPGDGIGTTRKYDSDGNLVWTRDHGNATSGFGNDVYAVTLETVGNTFGVYTGGNPFGVPDGMSTRKYDKCGTLIWSADSRVNQIGGQVGVVRDVALNSLEDTLYTSGTPVSTTDVGKVYIRIYNASDGTLLDSLPSFVTYDTSVSGIRIEWNSNGIFESTSGSSGQWIHRRRLSDLEVISFWQRAGSTGTGLTALDLDVDSATGDVYACGLGNQALPNSNIEKYSSAGGLIWSEHADMDAVEIAPVVAVSQVDSYVYAAGRRLGSPGQVLWQLNKTTGAVNWYVELTPDFLPFAGVTALFAVTGSVALTASRQLGAQDTVLVFDDSGVLLWSKDHGENTHDVALDACGNAHIVGDRAG